MTKSHSEVFDRHLLEQSGCGEIGWMLSSIATATGVEDSNRPIIPTVYEPFSSAKRGPLPQFDRYTGEQLVSEYLKQPQRHSIIDRALTQLLVNQEFYAYATTQLSPGQLSAQPLRQVGPLSAVAINLAANVVLMGLVWALLWALVKWTPFPEGWGVGLGIAAAVWVLGVTILQVLLLPRSLVRHAKVRSNVLRLLDLQNAAHLSLLSDGPVSPKQVRKAVEDAAEAGTVWPQSVYPLLDDIASRSGTM